MPSYLANIAHKLNEAKSKFIDTSQKFSRENISSCCEVRHLTLINGKAYLRNV
jgi:hypothetical protein